MNKFSGTNLQYDENGGGDIVSKNQQKVWTIGLLSSKFRYLTAEFFGNKINASGTSFKKKQVWFLEPSDEDSTVYLRSHQNKYLAIDCFGNLVCDINEKDETSKFQINVAGDGSGRWALRNVVRGSFLGASPEGLIWLEKVPEEAEFWLIQLVTRPQKNLKSIGRKRFAHLSDDLKEIHVDANKAWGQDTLFTLEFRLEEGGKYTLQTWDNKFLTREGKLVDECNPNCLFSLEYHQGFFALRDHCGAYLSPIGAKAVLKTRSETVTKDELFSLEDCLPQVSFVAKLNSKYVSIRQGMDVSANQNEISICETFQLEFDSPTNKWYIRTMSDSYWILETKGGIQASEYQRSPKALFELIWQEDGSLCFLAKNGKYVATKRSGHLYAVSDTITDCCKFFFYFVNRPVLFLKCDQGFVGYKGTRDSLLECNKPMYETVRVEKGENGVVYFKGENEKYWQVERHNLKANSEVPKEFFIELREPNKICIKSMHGEYLVADKNGELLLGEANYEKATKWEY